MCSIVLKKDSAVQNPDADRAKLGHGLAAPPFCSLLALLLRVCEKKTVCSLYSPSLLGLQQYNKNACPECNNNNTAHRANCLVAATG